MFAASKPEHSSLRRTIMQQVIVHEGPRAELVEAPIPMPAADEVVVRVVVAGSNPKDWKTWWVPQPINQGNDMAGFVHAVGSQVAGFQPGDRVVAFHDVATPHGTHADYATARAVVTAHLPPTVSFEGPYNGFPPCPRRFY